MPSILEQCRLTSVHIVRSITIGSLLATLVLPSAGQTPRRGIDGLRDNISRQQPAANNTQDSSPSGSEFRVESFIPLGRARIEDSIVVQFTTPLSNNLRPAELAALVSFDPNIEVDVSQESPRSIRFSPRRPLRPGTVYKARISPLAKDSSGRAIGGKMEFEFATDALDVTKVGQADFGPNRTVSISLDFNSTVSPAELRKYLSVLASGATLKFEILPNQTSRSFRVILRELPTGCEHVTLRIQSGLKGTQGPRPLEQTFDRRVPVRFDLQATEAEAVWRGDSPVINLSFNASISGEPKDRISVSPAVPFEVSNQGSRIELTGKFAPNQRYTIKLAPGIRGENGATLDKAVELSTFVPPMPAFVALQNAGGYLSLQGRMKLGVRHQGYPALRLRAWRLYDNNIPKYVHNGESDWEFSSYAQRVISKEIPIENSTEIGRTEIDLTSELGGRGAGYYRFELVGLGADGKEADSDYDWTLGRVRGRDSARIALTNLAVVAKSGPTSLGIWVVSLSDAKAVSDADVEVFSPKFQPIGRGRTNAEGFVTIENPAFSRDQSPAVVQVVAGQDRTFLDLSRNASLEYEGPGSTGRPFLTTGLEAFVTPDRGAYRPGETVRIFGFVRDQSGSAPSNPMPLNLQLTGPDGRRLPMRTIQVQSGTGAFETTATVSATAPTGLWRASLRLPGDRHRRWLEGRGSDEGWEERSSTAGYEDDVLPEDLQQMSGVLDEDELGAADFFVEEFVPNRLKVTAMAPEGRLSAVEPLVIQVRAEEMFGASAGERPFEGRVILRPEPFRAAGYEDFVFGNEERKFTRQEVRISEESLDSTGNGSARVELPPIPPPAALRATILMTVKDIGGRGVTSRLERILDPVPFYLGGKRPSKGFLPVGESSAVDLAAVRPDGQPVSDSIEVSATVYRVRWNSLLKSEEGRFTYEVTRELSPVETYSVRLQNGRGTLNITPKNPGAYLLIAQAVGSPGSVAPSLALNFYASTGQWQDEAWSMERPERVDLVADKERYEVGDTARIIVKAPFAGTLLLTTEQSGILHHEVRTLASNTDEIQIPITDKHLPNVYVSATVIRPVRPAGRWLPHRALGITSLSVNPISRRLALVPEVPTEVRPNATAKVSVTVADQATSTPAAGVPVTLWVVDEGILSLTNFQTPNPHGYFYDERRPAIRNADYMGQLMPDIDPAKAPSAPGGGEAGQRGFVSPVVADRVKPVAIWLGTTVSGADGKVTAEIPIPQFIGRLRVMAIAASGARFGSGEAELLVRNPVMIREGLPRFASPGDQLFIPVTAYNNTPEFATMGLRISATGPAKPISVGRWREDSPNSIAMETTATAGSSSTRIAEIQIPRQAGVAKFEITGTLGSDSYTETVEIPVRPAAPVIRRAGMIEVAPGKTETIPLGGDFLTGTERVTLSVGSMPMLAFAPALLDLIRQPFGCSEQVAAAAFPLLHLSDLAAAIEPDRLHRNGTTALVQGAIDRLSLMQTTDGGFSSWPGQALASPYNSVFVTHFLLEARAAGYEVQDEVIRGALGYCSGLLTENLDEADQSIIRAYATLVLAIAGTPDRAAMERVADSLPANGNEARAILASAFVRARLPERAIEILSDSKAPLQLRSSGGAYSSPIRETALLLAAWLDANPKSPEIPRLAQRLSSRTNKQGHFGNTQDNAFALFALGRLAKIASADKPASGEVRAPGIAPIRFGPDGPLTLTSDPLAGTTPTVTVDSSVGPAYVFYAVEGVPTILPPSETTVSQGITVNRRFLDRNGVPIVPRRLEQGSLLQVEIELGGTKAIQNLAIVDLLPAGFEIENPNLASSAADSSDEDSPAGITIQRTEVRDDRFLAFVDLNPSDKPRTLRYSVRCVTAGTFQMGPVQVTAMYDPDILARGGAGVVSINPKRNVTPAALP